MTDALGSSEDEQLIPQLADHSLPPVIALIRWLALRSAGTTALNLDPIPSGNGMLPSLCELAHIDQLRLNANNMPSHWLWQHGPGRVAITNIGAGARSRSGSEHNGPLLAVEDDGQAERQNERVFAEVLLARLADAAAVIDRSVGADWHKTLAALKQLSGRRPPVARTQMTHFESGPMRAWNPLPFARRCVVALPPDGDTPPWAVVDQRGAKHPLQVVEGPLGTQWLTELSLGPLECVDLLPLDEPVGGSHWEVSTTVLDNGRVRAELNGRGQISRLCLDGRFIDHQQPLVTPLVNGELTFGEIIVEVLEAGPTRGRLLVRIEDELGAANITYTLNANDDALQVNASWHGREGSSLVLRHRVDWEQGTLECCADAQPWTSLAKTTVFGDEPQTERGLHWAHYSDSERSIAFVSARPFALNPTHLCIPVAKQASYAILDGRRRASQLSLGHNSIALAIPGRHAGKTKVTPPLFRLVDGGGLVPNWVSHSKGWIAEMLLVDQSNSPGKAELYPDPRYGELQEACLVDVHGKSIQSLRMSKEKDAWVIPYRAGDVLLVRWR